MMSMKASESRAAFVKDWLHTVEVDIKAVREAQSNLIAREKKLSEKTFDFVEALESLSNHEASLSLRQCYSQMIGAIQSIEADHAKAIQHMERIVVQRLDEFRNQIRDQKEVVSQRNAAADRMRSAEKAIEKLASKPQRDEIKMIQSKQQLLSSEYELKKIEDTMSQGVTQLESARIDLIQDTIARYVNCSIYFHGKALESLSGLVKCIIGIDTDAEKAVLMGKFGSFAEPAAKDDADPDEQQRRSPSP